MKATIIFFILGLGVCSCIWPPSLPCEPGTVFQDPDNCNAVTCADDGKSVWSVGCAESRCAGPQVGVEEDKSKPYPGCCPRPICEKPKTITPSPET